MGRIHKDQKGFSLIEGLLVLVIVGLIAAVGWLVYDRQNNETNNSQTNSQPSQQTQKPPAEVKKSQTATLKSQKDETISDDIVICSVNTNAQSGAGLKVAFYGYVKGNDYSKVQVEYGSTSDSLSKKTTEFPNTGEDNCNELLATMPADTLSPGKYFYRVAARTDSGTAIYSKTHSFTKK